MSHVRDEVVRGEATPAAATPAAVTWFDEGLVHDFSHLNRERRAGRTWCGKFAEFWPKDLVGDVVVVVSCLACVAQPHIPIDAFDDPSAIQERWEDRVRACGENRHNRRCDVLGNCVECGYGQPTWSVRGLTLQR